MFGRRRWCALLAAASAAAFAPRAPPAPTAARRRPPRAAADDENPIVDYSSMDPIQRFEAENDGAKVFEKLVEYPCEFTIKVIGQADATFESDMVSYIARTVDKAADTIAFSSAESKKGTYTSVTIKAPVASAEELYNCYAVLRQDPRVKIAL